MNDFELLKELFAKRNLTFTAHTKGGPGISVLANQSDLNDLSQQFMFFDFDEEGRLLNVLTVNP